MLQVGLTNACNKTCGFCYRPLEAKSLWTYDSLLELARFCDEWGVLEVAFGGGEPTIFPRFAELLREIWETTGICPNFTTNGLRLTPELLRSIRGCYGQLQLSVYDEDDTDSIIDLLAREKASFGLNYLMTPARVRTLEADVLAYADRGVKDILFLSYKGTDPALHLSEKECRLFDESVAKLHPMFAGVMTFKVDVCWAGRLVKTPQLLNETDCQANIDFLSITSDKRVLSCSFSNEGVPFTKLEELREIYRTMQGQKIAARSPGCARLPEYGFGVRPDVVQLRARA
jgi:MoaA/NifB/PqqE/SkfB family radical SAM enzyme